MNQTTVRETWERRGQITHGYFNKGYFNKGLGMLIKKTIKFIALEIYKWEGFYFLATSSLLPRGFSLLTTDKPYFRVMDSDMQTGKLTKPTKHLAEIKSFSPEFDEYFNQCCYNNHF